MRCSILMRRTFLAGIASMFPEERKVYNQSVQKNQIRQAQNCLTELQSFQGGKDRGIGEIGKKLPINNLYDTANAIIKYLEKANKHYEAQILLFNHPEFLRA